MQLRRQEYLSKMRERLEERAKIKLAAHEGLEYLQIEEGRGA